MVTQYRGKEKKFSLNVQAHMIYYSNKGYLEGIY